MLLSTVKLPSAIVMWIIFDSLNTPPRSSKRCGCETFRVLKYLLSIFLHYTHPCRMILSKKKCCLLLNGVSTESQTRTSVLQIRRDFSPTRHMTRINVGLALSLVKLLLSSWKILYAIWWHGIPTNSGDSYGHKLFSAYSRVISILLREGFYVKHPEILTVWPHRQLQRYLSISGRYIHYW